ncbi:MAG: Na+/H+ antiporter subunit E [Gammaproteobacteria bacterium]
MFTITWWALTDGAVSSWWIGVAAVLLATVSSMLLLPPVSFSWYAFVKFVPVFLLRSLQGGVDVAQRAFHPAMPIAPDVIEYPLGLPPGLARVLMANIVSLLPGTLSAEMGTNNLTVHVLDGRSDFAAELVSIERSVALMFGISLDTPDGSLKHETI